MVVVAAADRSHRALQVKVNMLVVLVSEKASKEANVAGIPVPVVGVAADNHVTGFLSEEPHCFESTYIHWYVADSKNHYSYVYRTSSYLPSELLILWTFSFLAQC